MANFGDAPAIRERPHPALPHRGREPKNALPQRGREPETYNSLPVARDLTVKLGEDRPGALAALVEVLSRSGVNIEGLAEIDGVVHVLARDPNAARSALRSGGYEIQGELEVLLLPMPDRPGELSMILRRLADAGINLRFAYLATETRVVIGAEDVSRARQALGPDNN